MNIKNIYPIGLIKLYQGFSVKRVGNFLQKTKKFTIIYFKDKPSKS